MDVQSSKLSAMIVCTSTDQKKSAFINFKHARVIHCRQHAGSMFLASWLSLEESSCEQEMFENYAGWSVIGHSEL